MPEWLNQLLDRFGVLSYIGGLLTAFIWTRARQSFTLEQLEKRVAVVEGELAELQTRVGKGDTQFAVLVTEIGHLKAGISMIQQQLQHLKG